MQAQSIFLVKGFLPLHKVNQCYIEVGIKQTNPPKHPFKNKGYASEQNGITNKEITDISTIGDAL